MTYYRIIRTAIRKKHKLVTEDDVAITNCSGICDEINNFFINVVLSMA